MRALAFGATSAALVTLAGAAGAQAFSYMPSGELVPGSGQGRVDDTVYAPGMRFPIESAPAYANSQVWGHGGSQGPGGNQCDVENFSYPWWDNYCETRSWDMPLCPAGQGHQGQDIRAATCDKDVHWAVASADGTITNIGSYSVYLTAPDGTRYDYLHMSNVQVSVGQDVKLGDRLGKVSNTFGGTPTTVHLHFNLRQNVNGVGTVYVPPYMSLVTSYSNMLDAPPVGYLDESSCKTVRGWAFEPDEPEQPVVVQLGFDADVVEPVTADVYRGDLCENLSYCEHGFWRPAPLSLFDGEIHDVRATVGYAMGDVELAQSPATMDCAPIAPYGTLRAVDEATFGSWSFSSFWDEAPVDADLVAALPRGAPFAPAPELVSDGERVWVVDGGVRRIVADDDTAMAWRLDRAEAAILSPAELEALPESEPLPARPVLVRAAGGALQLVDGDFEETTIQPGGSDDDGGVPGDEAAVACGCRTAGATDHAHVLLLALSALGMAARRRRRAV